MNRRLLAIAVLAVGVACGLVAIRVWPNEIVHFAETLVRELQAMGPWGGLVLAAMQLVIATVGLLPASLLAIAAGLIYGVPEGFAIVASSTMLAALISFRLSRSLFHAWISRLVARRPRVAAFDALLARDGWRSVCLIRLSPIMPFAATSLMLGLSSIRQRDYLIGTLASLPALLGYVFLGSLTEVGFAALRSGGSWVQIALPVIGIAATLWATLRIGRMLARAIGTA